MSSDVHLIDNPPDGVEVALGLGGVAVIALPTPGATGHLWRVHADVEPQHVAVQPTDEVPVALDDPAARLPGRAGHTLFRVLAMSAGSDVITFTLQRPWQDVPQRTVQVRIDVRD